MNSSKSIFFDSQDGKSLSISNYEASYIAVDNFDQRRDLRGYFNDTFTLDSQNKTICNKVVWDSYSECPLLDCQSSRLCTCINHWSSFSWNMFQWFGALTNCIIRLVCCVSRLDLRGCLVARCGWLHKIRLWGVSTFVRCCWEGMLRNCCSCSQWRGVPQTSLDCWKARFQGPFSYANPWYISSTVTPNKYPDEWSNKYNTTNCTP